MADYSANPLADPDKWFSPALGRTPQVNDSLSVMFVICPSFVTIYCSLYCRTNVSPKQAINLASYFPTVGRSDGTSPPTRGTI